MCEIRHFNTFRHLQRQKRRIAAILRLSSMSYIPSYIYKERDISMAWLTRHGCHGWHGWYGRNQHGMGTHGIIGHGC